MRATVMFGAGDVRIESVPDASIIEPTDAVVTVTRACICGSDLWPYQKMEQSENGRLIGHEAIGIVEAVGADVRTIKAGGCYVHLRSRCRSCPKIVGRPTGHRHPRVCRSVICRPMTIW